MDRDIIKDLVELINRELHESNRNHDAKEEKRPEIGSYRRLLVAADYGLLAEGIYPKIYG